MKKTVLLSFLLYSIAIQAQKPIHEFNFDGSLANTSKTASFVGNAEFSKDRSGIDKKAIRLTNEGLIANIDNLPQTNAPRTISIWIKFNDITNSNYIWGYGAAVGNQYCGLIHQGTDSDESLLNVAAWGYKNDFVTTLPLAKGIWYNYTYVYDGKNADIYRNGVLIENYMAPNRNTLGSFFKLGNINSLISINADIDELKIYDVALSYEEIANQYYTGAALIIAGTTTSTKKGRFLSKTSRLSQKQLL
ncbi:LamG-like jellyroll fold domain-containing protein [Flavobacterium polysaccharolyticum]|uniref:LamG-like jellyroll fold domain-containing protein n=1 Tax=Flavobacterium polysaccharolyticum TaxID=3133148 RepID=A0ABU9NIH3_9FLAO